MFWSIFLQTLIMILGIIIGGIIIARLCGSDSNTHEGEN